MATMKHIMQMIISISIVLLCAVFSIIEAAGGIYGADWNYNNQDGKGPDNWGLNHSHCGGRRQSPVNIMSKDTVYNPLLGKLVLRNYTYHGPDVVYELMNRATDVAMLAKVKNGVKYPPQEIDFKGATYRFYQYHFHWGSTGFQGSEHLIDSQQAAAELHMIHYNTKYSSILDALEMNDGLLVWGHLLKVESKDKGTPIFNDLGGEFGNILSTGTKKEIPGHSLYSLLPSKHEHFYHYYGSLTTPGCYESVAWIVNRDAHSVSQRQMQHFRNLKDEIQGISLANNYRPAQDLNGRIVERNFEYGVSEAGAITKSSKVVMITMGLISIYLF